MAATPTASLWRCAAAAGEPLATALSGWLQSKERALASLKSWQAMGNVLLGCCPGK